MRNAGLKVFPLMPSFLQVSLAFKVYGIFPGKTNFLSFQDIHSLINGIQTSSKCHRYFAQAIFFQNKIPANFLSY
jgi:hypothetical protein